MLDENLFSPPRTPLIHSRQSQPVPQEPTFTARTYRPPSLYPNKKQKLEILEPVPPEVHTKFVAPLLNMFESSARVTAQPNMTFAASNSHYDSHVPRRQSLNRSDVRYRLRSPAAAVQRVPPASYRDVARLDTSSANSSQFPASTTQTPTSAASDHGRASALHPMCDSRSTLAEPRKFSMAGFDACYHPLQNGQRSQIATQQNKHEYSPSTTESLRRCDANGNFRRSQDDTYSTRTEFARGPYQNSGSLDGITSVQYEYYYTKARKRSNLPKHSTEIMRRWFDQVRC